jgi:hypothetical protein
MPVCKPLEVQHHLDVEPQTIDQDDHQRRVDDCFFFDGQDVIPNNGYTVFDGQDSYQRCRCDQGVCRPSDDQDVCRPSVDDQDGCRPSDDQDDSHPSVDDAYYQMLEEYVQDEEIYHENFECEFSAKYENELSRTCLPDFRRRLRFCEGVKIDAYCEDLDNFSGFYDYDK